MGPNLGRLIPTRRTGQETFRDGGKALNFSLLDFWQWSVSDLVSNATRGRLAEFLVAQALGGTPTPVRDEWAPVDLELPTGERIEVKSSAYLQSWHQQAPSRILFGTQATRAWDPNTNQVSDVVTRQATIYVFALLAHQVKATLDPLDVEQWQFYVVPTSVLDARTGSQRSITLKNLEALTSAVRYTELAEAVRRAGSQKSDATVPPHAPPSGEGQS